VLHCRTVCCRTVAVSCCCCCCCLLVFVVLALWPSGPFWPLPCCCCCLLRLPSLAWLVSLFATKRTGNLPASRTTTAVLSFLGLPQAIVPPDSRFCLWSSGLFVAGRNWTTRRTMREQTEQVKQMCRLGNSGVACGVGHRNGAEQHVVCTAKQFWTYGWRHEECAFNRYCLVIHTFARPDERF